MKKGVLKLFALFAAFCLLLSGCSTAESENDDGSIQSQTNAVQENSETAPQAGGEEAMHNSKSEESETMLQMKIGDTEVSVDWEENESVEALKELCREGSLTISMSMYGGFEQVGSIGQSLPRNDSQTTTQAGDIVLYSGSQIVVFYGSNSWAYTRLGHITDKSADEMAELLGGGDVTITIG